MTRDYATSREPVNPRRNAAAEAEREALERPLRPVSDDVESFLSRLSTPRRHVSDPDLRSMLPGPVAPDLCVRTRRSFLAARMDGPDRRTGTGRTDLTAIASTMIRLR